MYVDEFLKEPEYHILRQILLFRLFEKSPKAVLEEVTFQMFPGGACLPLIPLNYGMFCMLSSSELFLLSRALRLCNSLSLHTPTDPEPVTDLAFFEGG